ncbi:hypothetical protein HYS54_04270 [Candidatus Micrarchaeota archaeon]|nr:hypothetical protein [Candidatus Micrarchaeota archaeon]
MKAFYFGLLAAALLPLADAGLHYRNSLQEAQYSVELILVFQRAAAEADYGFQQSFRFAVISGLSTVREDDTSGEAAGKVCGKLSLLDGVVMVGRVDEGDFFSRGGLKPMGECACVSALRVERNPLRAVIGSGTGGCVAQPASFWKLHELSFGRLVSIVPYGTVIEAAR